MGVVTKRRKPARSNTHGVTWFAEPDASDNVLTAHADWSRVPVLISSDQKRGVLPVLMHDQSNYDIARLLLKIGIEIAAPLQDQHQALVGNTGLACRCVLGTDSEPWPYFVLRDRSAEPHLVSILASVPEAHDYARSCGFDLALHQVEAEVVLFLTYGEFRAAIAVTSRDGGWCEVLRNWEVPFVGCPIEFQHLEGPGA